MSLHEGAEQEYERRHNPIWRELTEILLQHGVSNYHIFLHPETRQLFAYAEVEDEARWNAIAETDVCRRWWDHMRDLMPSHADGSPCATDLRRVFSLDESSAGSTPAS